MDRKQVEATQNPAKMTRRELTDYFITHCEDQEKIREALLATVDKPDIFIRAFSLIAEFSFREKFFAALEHITERYEQTENGSSNHNLAKNSLDACDKIQIEVCKGLAQRLTQDQSLAKKQIPIPVAHLGSLVGCLAPNAPGSPEVQPQLSSSSSAAGDAKLLVAQPIGSQPLKPLGLMPPKKPSPNGQAGLLPARRGGISEAKAVTLSGVGAAAQRTVDRLKRQHEQDAVHIQKLFELLKDFCGYSLGDTITNLRKVNVEHYKKFTICFENVIKLGAVQENQNNFERLLNAENGDYVETALTIRENNINTLLTEEFQALKIEKLGLPLAQIERPSVASGSP